MKPLSSKVSSESLATVGLPFARPVWAAVNEAERRICGDAAVPSRSVAEGLALAGRRAARLIQPSRDEAASGAAVAAPWVDHRVRHGGLSLPRAHAFELVASSGQQAVDHCLVAHRMSAMLGRP